MPPKNRREWRTNIPIYEFTCPNCLNKIERIVFGKIKNPFPICQKCNQAMKMKEFSVPARRNPEYGMQK